MNNSVFNLIIPVLYFKNINSYQYESIIEVKEKQYSEFIYKDLLKDFYCNLIDNDIDLKEESEYNHDLVSKSSEYNYVIIDRTDLKLFYNNYELYISFLLELVYFLDADEIDKFDIIFSLINYVGVDYNKEDKSFTEIDYVIKLKKVARNLLSHPIVEDNIEERLMWVEGYNYNNITEHFNY